MPRGRAEFRAGDARPVGLARRPSRSRDRPRQRPPRDRGHARAAMRPPPARRPARRRADAACSGRRVSMRWPRLLPPAGEEQYRAFGGEQQYRASGGEQQSTDFRLMPARSRRPRPGGRSRVRERQVGQGHVAYQDTRRIPETASKWLSRETTGSRRCRAIAAIQVSLIGIGVPACLSSSRTAP